MNYAIPRFRSFIMAGFECSTPRLDTGRRLDMLSTTQHDQFALQDFQRLQAQGIRTARVGLRWHLVETQPGYYDFSSALPTLKAAATTNTQLLWDLCHYGWPDDLDVFTPNFVRRFRNFAQSFARFLAQESDLTPIITPINEISFLAWVAGDHGSFSPFERGRSFELKTQLVRAAIEAIEAFWAVLPATQIFHCDPVINILPSPHRPHERENAEGYQQAQYQGWDMLCGKLWPQLGGADKYLPMLGLNFYPTNQWFYNDSLILRGHELYRPFRDIVQEIYLRYQCPMFVAETGAEGDERADWFQYVCDEIAALVETGLPIAGICHYPILEFPGWIDDRECHNGLWGRADAQGFRPVYQPLLDVIQAQQLRFEGL